MRYALNIVTLFGTSALLIFSQNIFHWISFLPNFIPVSYLFYIAAASIVIGCTLSALLKQTNSKKGGTFSQLKVLIARWLKYNIISAAIVVSWTIYLAIVQKAEILTLLLGYGLVSFAIVNSVLLLSSCFFANNINYLDIILAAFAAAGSLWICNKYFNNYFKAPADYLAYIVFGTVIITIITVLLAKLSDTTKDNKTTGGSDFFSNKSLVFILGSIVCYSALGLGIYYSAGSLTVMQVIVPLAIFAGLTTLNFISANNFAGSVKPNPEDESYNMLNETLLSPPHNTRTTRTQSLTAVQTRLGADGSPPGNSAPNLQ